MWKRLRKPAPEVGDLSVWESVDEDGVEHITFAEMTADPAAAGVVELLKQALRERGWTQTIGD